MRAMHRLLTATALCLFAGTVASRGDASRAGPDAEGASPPSSASRVPDILPRKFPLRQPREGYLHGINVGHWLLLERWMDPGTLFAGPSNVTDQFAFDQVPGAAAALRRHWDTFLTAADVHRLRGYGFNALRIPIGFWAYDNVDTPYLQGADAYLERAVGWARDAGMKVLIDLHGSPGSQNGDAGSGRAGKWRWQSDGNLQRSTAVVLAIVGKYGQREFSDVVMGVSLVNQLFTGNDSALTQKQHIDLACTWAEPLWQTRAAGLPVYVGEWAAVTKICVLANGTSVASRSGGGSPACPTGNAGKGCTCATQDTAQWSPKLVGAVRWFVEAQLDVFLAHADGDFVWGFGGPGAWGVDNLVKIGAWPVPLADRQFSSPCGEQQAA